MNKTIIQDSFFINKHLLNQAIYLESPNFDLRPDEQDISLLVIHCASLPRGDFNNNNVEQLFCGKMSLERLKQLDKSDNLKVSAHLYIKRNGEIYQFVPFNLRAW